MSKRARHGSVFDQFCIDIWLQTEAAALEELGGEARGAFTFAALWSALPLDVFAQCIGTANRNPRVRERILEARKLGTLSARPWSSRLSSSTRRADRP